MDEVRESASSETSPLLQSHRTKADSKTSITQIQIDDRPWLQRIREDAAVHWAHWKACYICGLLIFTIDFGSLVCTPAMLRMLEAAVCRRYYAETNPLLINEQGDVPELYCKLNPIQEEVALIRGWMGSIDGVVGVLFAIPWGVLADKKGRRFVTAVAVLGLLLSQLWYFVVCYFHNTFPPRWIWAGSAFLIIGGGSTVALGVIIGIVADTAPPDLRAQVLFYISASDQAAMVAAPPLGAVTLKYLGYWWPVVIGFSIEIASSIMVVWLPTVTKGSKRHIAGGEEEIAENTGAAIPHDEEEDPVTTPKQRGLLGRLLAEAEAGFVNVAVVLNLMFTNTTLIIGFMALVVTRINLPISTFLPQFASKRFGWTISDASYITSIQALATILHLTLLLPLLTRLLKHRLRISGPRLDLHLSHLSIPFSILGCFLLGHAATPPFFVLAIVIYVLGTGYRASLESFLASAVRPDQMATLYVAISVVDTIGIMIMSPALAIGFREGLKRGDGWIGLPFLGAAAMFAGSAVLSALLRVKGGRSSSVFGGMVVVTAAEEGDEEEEEAVVPVVGEGAEGADEEQAASPRDRQ